MTHAGCDTSRYARALALVAALGACGCYESGFALDQDPRAPMDPALVGTWRCLPVDADADERPATVVVKTARPNVYGVTWQEEGGTPEQYEAHASSALPRLLNVRAKTARSLD